MRPDHARPAEYSPAVGEKLTVLKEDLQGGGLAVRLPDTRHLLVTCRGIHHENLRSQGLVKPQEKLHREVDEMIGRGVMDDQHVIVPAKAKDGQGVPVFLSCLARTLSR